ncbi:LysR family transcriptional regulator [Falsiruegeria mediterranea]|uniref:LysR family transcriptional regulator n=1 Tax=Falsiruegeria mediterranea TaxID=1280832 RepID=UPI0027BAC30F|nr:LysR family transcriptional regulator [Falsiruegeria mediterranea]
MGMSIRSLRTLIAVHRHGSFRAASEAEHLTPSAVSHQMRNLEVALGLELFDRTAKSPELTHTGLMFVGEAAAVVTAYDGLAERVRSNNELSGEITLGAVPTTLTGLVPIALSKLKSAHPNIHVRIVPGLTNHLLLQLDRGQIQAAIISRPDILPNTLEFSEIVSEKLVLLVSENTPDLPPKDLLGASPFIRFTRDAVVGRQIETWLQRKGIEVRDAMELESLEAISSMVAADLGVSIIPDSHLAAYDHLRLKRIPLEQNGPKRIVGLASMSTSPRTKMIDAVTTALLDAAGNQQVHL